MDSKRLKYLSRQIVRAPLLLGLLVLSLPLPAMAVKVISEKTVPGFKFPESCAYDPAEKVLYVGSFGGTELKPGEKDNNGYISKVSVDGKILEERFLPGASTMNKPKGIWVAGSRLWVTDIDGVWVFHTKTREGKKLALPGAQFANDVAIIGDTLYVSDNRGDVVYSVTPADFLTLKDQDLKVATTANHKGVNANGIYPAQDGSLLMVGSKSDKEKRGIWSMKPGQEPVAISKEIGRLDGLYQMNDGTLLVTDWDTGSLFAWNEKAGATSLASGFKGPADLCAFPNANGVMVVVPDLVKSELRMIQLGS